MEASSAEARGRFHGSFHGSFHVSFYGNGSFHGSFIWKIPWNLPVALPRKIPRCFFFFRGLPRSSRGSTYFRSPQLRHMHFNVLALLPPQMHMSLFCLPRRKGNRLKPARKEVSLIFHGWEQNGGFHVRKRVQLELSLQHQKPPLLDSMTGLHALLCYKYWTTCVFTNSICCTYFDLLILQTYGGIS